MHNKLADNFEVGVLNDEYIQCNDRSMTVSLVEVQVTDDLPFCYIVALYYTALYFTYVAGSSVVLVWLQGF